MTKRCPPDLAAFKHEPADYEQPVEAVTVEQCDWDFADRVGVITEERRGIVAREAARHRTQANETMREALERIAAMPDGAGRRAKARARLALAALSGDSA